MNKEQKQDTKTYPIGDSDLLPENASQEQVSEWTSSLLKYSDEWFEEFVNCNLFEEHVWLDFTCTFRSHSMEIFRDNL